MTSLYNKNSRLSTHRVPNGIQPSSFLSSSRPKIRARPGEHWREKGDPERRQSYLKISRIKGEVVPHTLKTVEQVSICSLILAAECY